jgi:hypothetical protein
VKEKTEIKKPNKRKRKICFQTRTMGQAHSPNDKAKKHCAGYAARPVLAAEGGV